MLNNFDTIWRNVTCVMYRIMLPLKHTVGLTTYVFVFRVASYWCSELSKASMTMRRWPQGSPPLIDRC